MRFPDTTFSDADSDTLTYTATQADGTALPSWLSFSTSTRTFSGTPQAADVATVSVKVTASDGSASVSDTFDIVVSAAGDTTAPTLTSAVVNETGQLIQLRFSENVDRSNLTPASAVTVTAGASPLTITGVTVPPPAGGLDKYRVLVTPAIRQGQAVIVTYTDPTAGNDANAIQDTAGNDAASFTTGSDGVPAVTNGSTLTNTAPTVAAVIPDQTATAATAFSYAFPDTTFSDADGDTLTYTATQADGTALPSWLSFSTSTRTFSGTPQTADVATVSVKVTASDGSASVSDTFDIVVSAAGDTTAPTLTSAVVNETGQLIQLRFSENVDRSNLTPASAVTVTAGASPLTITGVTVPPPAGGLDLYRVLVTPAIRQGQAVIVTYTDPTAGNDANAIQDTAGNDAASFTTGSDGVPAVTNGSTLTNTAPTVAAVIPDQTATAATAFSYAFPDTTFSDADGDTLTYTATQADGTALPSWLSFSTSTRTFSGTPQTADVATVSVKVTASDGSASVSDTFDIVVSAAGDTTAPTLTSAVVNETGQLIQLRFSENVDRSNLTPASAVTVTAGASPLTITGVTVPPPAGGLDLYRVLVTPAIRQGQAVIVTYTDPTAGNDANAIQDTAGNDAASFTTGSDGVPAVTNGSTLTNTAPTVAAVIPDQTATAATAFSYAFPDTTFSDADGDTLTYTATQADGTALPSWLSFSTSTRTFSGTPQTADVATVSVKVTASDGSASVSDTFDIVVSAAGDTTAPTLTSAVVNETGQLIQLRFSENVDRSNLTPASAVTVTAGASPLTITGVTVPPPAGGLDLYRVLVTPAIRQGQAVIVTYTDPTAGNDANAIQDTAGNDAASFTTGSDGVPAVTNGSTLTNTAPTVAAVIPDQTATAATAFSYAFPDTTFSDADGDTLTYTATQADGTALPSWLSFSTSTRTFSGTPQTADVATVSVKVTASDGSASVSDTFDIVVSAAGDTTAPTLTSAVVNETGQLIQLRFSENVDRSNLTPASAVTVTAGASPLTITGVTVPPPAGGLDLYRVLVTPAIRQGQAVIVTYTDPTAGNDANAIQDTAGNDAASFTTGSDGVPAVTNGSTLTNTAPTVAAVIPDQTATAATAFSYAFPDTTFSDADSDTLTYTATQADGTALPSWLSFSTSTRTFSGTPQTADVATVSVKVTASDGSASVSDTFDIVVSAAGDTTAPTLTSAVVNETGQLIQLRFSENVDRSNLTPASAVTVTAGASPLTITGVTVPPPAGGLDLYRVLVTPAIRQGQAVIVTYTDPTAGNDANAIQDTAGNDAASFTTGSDGVPAVTNGSTLTNTAPTVAAVIPDQTATAATAFSYAFPDTTFSDADGDTLTYTATQADGTALPSWLSFSTSTRTFSGTPQAADVATVSVKVTASDGSASVSDTFDIVVSAAGDTTAPTLTSAVVNETGQLIQLRFSENVDRSNLTPASAVTVTAGASPLTITGVTVPMPALGLDLYRVLVTPAIRQGQAVIVTYTDPTAGNDANAIQDTAGNDAASFTTGSDGVPAVTNGSTLTNTAPTVAAVIPDQTATAATAFSYAFPDTTFSDADGDTLTYTATQADGTALPSWLSFSTSTRTFSGTPQTADVATVSVKVTASDGSASVSDTFDIVVSAAVRGAPFGVVVDAPSGAVGLMRARWQAPPNASGIQGYHVRYRTVGTVLGASFRKVRANARELLLRYLEPGAKYEAQICTVGRGERRGPCSLWARLQLAARNTVPANDFTVSLELPG